MTETSTQHPQDPRIRSLKWLTVAAAASSLAAALALGLTAERTGPAFEERLAFPEFANAMETVDRVEVATNEVTFTLEKSGETWGVAERGHYPARPEALRSLLWGLGDLKLVERKTARPERHEALGLGEPEEDSEAKRIRIFRADGQPLLGAIFGNPVGSETLEGDLRTYMRVEGEDQTWVAEGRLEVESALEEWMDLDFLDLDASRVASVHSIPGDTSQGSDAFTIARPDKDTYNFELLDIYDGEAMSGPTAANGLGRTLIAMTFSDAMPARDIGFDNATAVRFETFDGLALTLRIKRHEEEFWVALDSETFDLELPVESEEANDEPASEEPLDVRGEADHINSRAGGWAFKIPEWKGNQLTVARASLIKNTQEDETNENE